MADRGDIALKSYRRAGAYEFDYHSFLMRFPIRFDPWFRLLSTVVFLPPSGAYVDVENDRAEVRMSWGFRVSFPIAAVARTSLLDRKPISRGVHGRKGRWLVNGSGQGIVVIDLEPEQNAQVLGFPVQLRQLMVSVEDPDGLRALLAPR